MELKRKPRETTFLKNKKQSYSIAELSDIIASTILSSVRALQTENHNMTKSVIV